MDGRPKGKGKGKARGLVAGENLRNQRNGQDGHHRQWPTRHHASCRGSGLSNSAPQACLSATIAYVAAIAWIASVAGCVPDDSLTEVGALQAALEDSPAAPIPDRVESLAELQRMRDYVNNRIPPESVRRSFTTPDGDTVDCIDIYAQPALRRPELRGHEVQLQPTHLPVDFEPAPTASTPPDLAPEFAGNWACDEGTIPLRRVTLEELRRFRNLDEFFQKRPDFLLGEEEPREGATSLHQYVAVRRTLSNRGGQSHLNLWSPFTELTSEFSLSQIWAARGSLANLESVEAGWQVYRQKYGDSRARLFIYFTPDNYGSGGCYNLDCSGFIQVNNSVAIGTTWSSYSKHGFTQYAVKLLLFKDGTSGSWWLRYNDVWVGYWPRSLFDSNGIRDYASRVTFGGEIIDRQTGDRHTLTDMGSGRFADEGFGYAAYQRDLKFVDLSNVYQDPGTMTAIVTDQFCYDLQEEYLSDPNWERHFYFGGPGYSSICE